MNRKVYVKEISSSVKVAAIIERGKIKPRWFERLDIPSSDRVQVKEICYTWTHYDGAAKILHFAVYDGRTRYELALNLSEFTWRLSGDGE